MIKAIITDIEGTTTSLSFVKDVLFPYARTQLPAFVNQHHAEPAINTLLADVSREVGRELTVDETINQLIAWSDADLKITPLKSLQGYIWQAGYAQGDFTGHLYDDVLPCLQAWQAQGIQLYVYSSGSVPAQKLLFGHTAYGDVTPLFSGYFDTHIGGKKEVRSYQRIAEQIGFAPDSLLFLSDMVDELDAAQAAGWQTYQLVRENERDSSSSHRQVHSFADICF